MVCKLQRCNTTVSQVDSQLFQQQVHTSHSNTTAHQLRPATVTIPIITCKNPHPLLCRPSQRLNHATSGRNFFTIPLLCTTPGAATTRGNIFNRDIGLYGGVNGWVLRRVRGSEEVSREAERKIRLPANCFTLYPT